MLSVSNLLCDHETGSESLRYGHTPLDGASDPEQRIPRPVVVWALTRACNLKCVHCYASATSGPAPGELTGAEGRALLADLAAFEVPAVLFSGGEPLVRPDALDLMTHAARLGLRMTLSTNGVLIDDRMADHLASLGLRYVGISLDGVAARHDRLRGARGAFDRSVAAIDRCRARGLRVGVRFTVHALNRADLDAIFDLCLERGIHRLCVYHLAYAGRGTGMRKVALEPHETRAVVDRIVHRTCQAHAEGHRLEVLTVGNHADAAYLLVALERTDPQRARAARRRLAGTGGNRSGLNIAAIDPRGGVHYDQFSWHHTCGNVRRSPFSRLWADPADRRLQLLRDRPAHLPVRCRTCRFIDVCNGNLRSRAEAATGDWLGFDPGCYLNAAEIAAGGAGGGT